MILSESDIERLWSKIDRRGADECWPWKAKSTLQTGYGVLNIWVEPNRRRNVVASRIVCFLTYGPPPGERIHALHSCDNPPCCNPAHLRWGTHTENMADAKERHRTSAPPLNRKGRNIGKMPRGSAVAHSVLTETKVRAAWSLHLNGKNVSEIAAALITSKFAVQDLVRGKTWRHLSGAPTIEELRAGGARRGSNGFNDLARARLLAVRDRSRGHL